MEESGHYYTVYYTSLAVGFAEDVAYRHAVLAQMPDEVSWLDAAAMYLASCFDPRGSEDLGGRTRRPSSDWRYLIQSAIHSLPNRYANADVRSSAYQRRHTTSQLMSESPVSLKFGLLLHRLGDSYAHSVIGHEERMYTVSSRANCWPTGISSQTESNLGHGIDGHSPDYPFLRPNLFHAYVANLYDVLDKKLKEYPVYRRSNARAVPLHELRSRFAGIFNPPGAVGRALAFNHLLDRTTMYSFFIRKSDEEITQIFIQAIRNDCLSFLQVRMRDYAPENEEALTLREFLDGHPELRSMGINENSLTGAINSMQPQQSMEEWIRSLTPEEFRAWQQEQAARAGININNININNLMGLGR